MCHFDLDIVSMFCVCHHEFGMTVRSSCGIHLDWVACIKRYTQAFWMCPEMLFTMCKTCAYDAICSSSSRVLNIGPF